MKKLVLLLLSLPYLAHGQFDNLVPFTVTAVFDGDGFKGRFTEDGPIVSVRIVGVDAPEIQGYCLKTQPYGREAGNALRELIKGKTILLDTLPTKDGKSRDYWGRLLAEPYTADTSSIAFWLVQHGHAWAVRVPGRTWPFFNDVEREVMAQAKLDGLGLWASYLTKDGKKARVYKPSTWRKKYSIR